MDSCRSIERRLYPRRIEDRARPEGGAVIVTILIFSVFAATSGFVAGIWIGFSIWGGK